RARAYPCSARVSPAPPPAAAPGSATAIFDSQTSTCPLPVRSPPIMDGNLRREKGLVHEAFGDQFSHVFDLWAIAHAGFGGLEHLHTEWAAHRQHFRAGRFGFFIAIDIDRLRAMFFFLPELRTTGPAAERIAPVTRHLDQA